MLHAGHAGGLHGVEDEIWSGPSLLHVVTTDHGIDDTFAPVQCRQQQLGDISIEARSQCHTSTSSPQIVEDSFCTFDGQDAIGSISMCQVLAEGRISRFSTAHAFGPFRNEIRYRLPFGGAAHFVQLLRRDHDIVLGKRRDERIGHVTLVFHSRSGKIENHQLDRAHLDAPRHSVQFHARSSASAGLRKRTSTTPKTIIQNGSK